MRRARFRGHGALRRVGLRTTARPTRAVAGDRAAVLGADRWHARAVRDYPGQRRTQPGLRRPREARDGAEDQSCYGSVAAGVCLAVRTVPVRLVVRHEFGCAPAQLLSVLLRAERNRSAADSNRFRLSNRNERACLPRQPPRRRRHDRHSSRARIILPSIWPNYTSASPPRRSLTGTAAPSWSCERIAGATARALARRPTRQRRHRRAARPQCLAKQPRSLDGGL